MDDADVAVQKVLSIDEVLELILEYAASMQRWESSSNLRRVSRRWRSLSFKGLCQSIWLPKLCIQEDFYYDDCPNLSVSSFKKLFPKMCPDKMTLSKPVLPFELVIRRLPTTDELSLIREMALHIAAVEVAHEPKETWDVHMKQDINSQLKSLQFPNLRKLQVYWAHAIDEPLFKEIVNNLIATASKRLFWLKYQYPFVSDNIENWPKPPSNLTHICYYGDGRGLLDLQKLLIGTVDKLSGLSYIIYKGNRTGNTTITEFTIEDCRTLSGILQHYSKTFRKLFIRPLCEVEIRGWIEVDQMNSLKILESEVPLHFRKCENTPGPLNLTYLKYKIHRHPGIVLAAFETISIYSSSLEVLALDWSRGSPIRSYDSNFAANKRCEEAFLEELEKGLPVCSQLQDLRVFMFTFRLGVALMPRIYESMKNLTSLRLYLNTETAQEARPTPHGNRDLFKMLTGCGPEDVPKDELLWPRFLIERNTGSITSLKALISIDITAPGRLKSVLGRFIFRAGFMQMRKLRRIEVHCGIMVDAEMKREWNQCGRVINTDRLVYGSSDSPKFSSDDESASSDA